MNKRHPRLILATAAVFAALAAASCGSPSLSEDLGSEEALAPSSAPAGQASSETFAEAEASSEAFSADALPSLKELSELEIEFPVDPRVSIDDGNNSIPEDSYMEHQGAFEVKAQVGMGWTGEGFEPIYENVLAMYSEPGLLNYALWGFRDLDWGINVMESVTVHGQGNFGSQGGYYIAYPEYEEGRWQLLGPYKQFGVEIPFEDDALISQGGHSYLAVLVFGGDSVQLRGLNVEVDSKAI